MKSREEIRERIESIKVEQEAHLQSYVKSTDFNTRQHHANETVACGLQVKILEWVLS